MKKIIVTLHFSLLTAFVYSQNIGINTDGSTAEAGVVLDVKGINGKGATGTQNAFQVKSNDALYQLKLRLVLGTNVTATSMYGAIEVADSTGAGTRTYRHLAFQPSGGNVGIATTAPAALLDIVHSSGAPVSGAFRVGRAVGQSTYISAIFGGGPFYSYIGTISGGVEKNNITLHTTGNVSVENGNFGVGVTNATVKAEITGAEANNQVGAGSAAALKIVNTNAGIVGRLSEIQFGHTSATKFAAISGYISDGSSNSRGDILFSTRNLLGDANLTERMRIDGAGNVGIATTTPATKLEIYSNTIDHLRLSSSNASTWSLTNFNAGYFGIRENANAASLSILNGGNVGIGTIAPSRRLTIQNPTATSTNNQLLYLKQQPNDYGYSFNIDDVTTGRMYIQGVNAGVEANIMTMDRVTNFVGIGNTAPAEKLHVTGNIRASSLAGSGTVLVQADNNGTLAKSNLSGLIPPLVAIDIAHNFAPGLNSPNHVGLMASYKPSTGEVFVISTYNTTNIENMDLAGGVLGCEWNADLNGSMTWTSFLDPNGVGTSYVIALDVAVTTFESSDACSGIITARMSNGDLYMRTTNSSVITAQTLDNPANWSGWTLMTDPGE